MTMFLEAFLWLSGENGLSKQMEELDAFLRVHISLFCVD